jgi:quercetin dioxygenase-like cupin family protein
MNHNFGSSFSLLYFVLLLLCLTSAVTPPAMSQSVHPTSTQSALVVSSAACKVIATDDTDGVLVVPQNHKVLYETDDVRVLEVTVAPHTREIMHTHVRPAVMYLDQPGTGRMHFAATNHASQHAFNPNFKPIAIWLAPEKLHAMENTGDTMFHAIRVEFKHPGCSLSPNAPVIDPGPNDAVKVWPEGHLVLFENEEVRVLDVRNAPHSKEPFHTHLWPGFFYVVQGEPMKYSTQNGAPPIMLGVPPVKIIPLSPNPMHSVENLGDQEAHFIRFELKLANAGIAATAH